MTTLRFLDGVSDAFGWDARVPECGQAVALEPR